MSDRHDLGTKLWPIPNGDGRGRLALVSGTGMSHPSRQTMIDKAIADRKRISEWLVPHMKRGAEKTFTKEQYRQLAINDLGPISKAAFDFAWVSAIEQTGRHDWYNPKPRRKETKQ